MNSRETSSKDRSSSRGTSSTRDRQSGTRRNSLPQKKLAEHTLLADRKKNLRRRHSITILNQEPAEDTKPPAESPYWRFRRKARVIRLLCMGCLAYMRAAKDKALKGTFLGVSEEVLTSAELEAKSSGNEPSSSRVTLLSSAHPDLTFDPLQFQRFSLREEGLPTKIKEFLRLSPSERTIDIVRNIVRAMQSFEEFAKYPSDIQEKMCKCAWWDRFGRNRVIIKDGQKPEGLYIVLCGKLTENTRSGGVYILKKGDKFGEADLIKNENRISTVMSKGTVELFCLHGQDYEEIFNTKSDMSPEACITILKQNPVFYMWPGLEKLLENPNSWGFQNYRAGQVIVADSRFNEWIYVIKAGRCDVLQKLVPLACCIDRSKTRYRNRKKAEGAEEVMFNHKQQEEQLLHRENSIFITSLKTNAKLETPRRCTEQRKCISGLTNKLVDRKKRLEPGMYTVSLDEIPRKMLQKYGTNGTMKRGSEADIPAMVRVTEMEAGDVFGLYSCIPDSHEAVVSMVSQGAEAIRINKAFFLKHSDERVYMQIEMRYPPFPNQDDILEELDISTQWQQFREKEMNKTLVYLKQESDLQANLAV